MKIARYAMVAALALSLGACAGPGYRDGGNYSTGYGTKETIGTLTGAALGGWAGSTIGRGKGRLVATAAGVLIGGLVGNQIGRSLDRQDQMAAYGAQTDALESYPDGSPSRWDNPNNGNYGYTTPTRTYQSAPEQYCREYQTTVVVGGRAQSGYGTACREPDGSWRIVG